jgi:phytoene dehydrogenase-like protein
VASQQHSVYDAIVIEAGHTGLTCACYLAKAGLKVLVLEQYHTVGGMTISEEITRPGFLSDIYASGYWLGKLSPAPQELELVEYGLEPITPDPNWVQVFPDGSFVTINHDVEDTAQSIAQFSERDADTWRNLYKRHRNAKTAIVAGMNAPPPSLAKEFGRPEAVDGYRFEFQSARSWVEKHFESEKMKAFLASLALHAILSPDDALGGQFAWLFATSVQDVGVSVIKGGMRHVSLALARVFETHGGEIRTNAKVREIVVEGGKAVGVRLEHGEMVHVDGVVASNTDPHHLVLDLLGERQVGSEVADKIHRYEWGDSFFTIYAAFESPIEFRAGPEASQAGYIHAAGSSVDDLSQMFAECRGGKLPATPMVGVINESGVDPSRAPEGKALMKFVVHYVPYRVRGDATGQIRGTHWDEIKEPYADYLIDCLTDTFLPRLRDRIIARVSQSPVDLEHRIISAVHGTHQHGAYLPYQVGPMRPIPELSHYRTPVPNVHLCGAGSHPGPGVSMAPGRKAAQVIHADLALDFSRSVVGQPNGGR